MSRSCKSGPRESEYTWTAGGVDPQTLDHPISTSESQVGPLVRPGTQQDSARYYEPKDPGTSTDVFDTDNAKQTTSLNLQQASMMAAQEGDETPLIFATQTATTVADLDIEGFDPDNPGGFPPVGATSLGSTPGTNIPPHQDLV